ncbi:TnsD family Tn7-like transposition protein [Oceanimonas pelagia]|uniref:TnsD family Tn7-like transposition protein n=1 Tax=Oceanimonas pelagia TaxID=3028314 RepID=A0AA50Q7K4_9GAMM|nr:TnsD family Tn7-like transposition protein [Oceanimonas pelagia]WMC10660.1 TnsD family Tn7-like transposition protein [Oceanimonas pelagia]
MRVPKPFPDELVLSRLIRYVTMFGMHIGDFSEKAFGSKRASVHPFLPAGIEQLATLIGENKDDIVNEQTLAPLFCLFMPRYAAQLRRVMLAREGAKAVRYSQLASFGSGETLCLKWCPLCAGNELQQLGVAYWHRSHQIPGITACPFHPVLLHRMPLLRRQRVMAGCLPKYTDRHTSAAPLETRVARFAYELLQLITCESCQLSVASGYRLRLAELGFITKRGCVRREGVIKAFIAAAEEYRAAVDTVLPRHAQDYRYVSQLLEPESNRHPFRHLLFSSWLYRQPQDMLDYAVPSLSISAGNKRDKPRTSSNVERKCLRLLKENRSMAEVSRITGKSRCYLKRLAQLHDIPITTRPRTLTEECKQRILRFAQAGVHRSAISKRCGIGIGSVEQVISSTPGLVERRKLCHWESMRRRCRVQIIRYRNAHPKAHRKDYKSRCNAAFFWLYLNDRLWLQAVLPEPVKPAGRYA